MPTYLLVVDADDLASAASHLTGVTFQPYGGELKQFAAEALLAPSDFTAFQKACQSAQRVVLNDAPEAEPIAEPTPDPAPGAPEPEQSAETPPTVDPAPEPIAEPAVEPTPEPAPVAPPPPAPAPAKKDWRKLGNK